MRESSRSHAHGDNGNDCRATRNLWSQLTCDLLPTIMTVCKRGKDVGNKRGGQHCACTTSGSMAHDSATQANDGPIDFAKLQPVNPEILENHPFKGFVCFGKPHTVTR